MRKLIFIVPLLVFCLFACKKHKADPIVKAEIKVENVISTDREYMTLNYDSSYKWYESCVTLDNFLDSDSCAIASVTNVFQVVKSEGEDVFVVLATHTPDTTVYNVQKGFWVEDFSLNDEQINLKFEEALDTIMATNSPKPHSKQCVLRKQVGPVPANPQYIFGNVKAQLYVDAVTGKVTDVNPCFPKK